MIIWWDKFYSTLGVSLKMEVPQARWMVFVNGKVPSFEMEDVNWGSPMTQETSNELNYGKSPCLMDNWLVVWNIFDFPIYWE